MKPPETKPEGSPNKPKAPRRPHEHKTRDAHRLSLDDCPGVPSLREEAENQVQCEREDGRVVRERDDRVDEDGAADAVARDGDVGGLVTHADREGEVREVEIVGRAFAGEVQSADAFVRNRAARIERSATRSSTRLPFVVNRGSFANPPSPMARRGCAGRLGLCL